MTCETGYQLSSDRKTCSLVCSDPFCKVCSPAEVCTSCIGDNILVTNNGKTFCQPKCGKHYLFYGSGCIALSTGQDQTACPSGFVLNSVTFCSSCFDIHFLNGYGTCKLCSDSLANCFSCSSPTTCSKCKSGYYVDSSNQCAAYNCASSVKYC